MIGNILLVVLGLLIAYIVYIIIDMLVLVPMKINSLQKKFGDRVETAYYPVLGLFKIFQRGEAEYRDAQYFFTKTAQKNNKVECLVTNIHNKVLYSFIDPKLSNEANANDLVYYQKYEMGYFRGIFGKLTLGGLYGKTWKKQRAIWAHHFNFQKFYNNIGQIDNKICKYIDGIKKDFDFNETIGLQPTIKRLVSETVVEMYFSHQIKDSSRLVIKSEELGLRTFQILKTSVYLGLKMIFLGDENAIKYFRTKEEQELVKDVYAYKDELKDIIKNRIKMKEDPNYKKFIEFDDFLDCQLNNGTIDLEIMTDQFVALFFAGIDTIMSTFVSMLYFMGKYPEQQRKMRQEMYDVIGQDISKFTFDDLKKLNNVQYNINESLRMKSPAPMTLIRKAMFDHKIGEYQIKKGDFVNVNISAMNYNTKYYENPEKYDPSRWQNHELLTNLNFIPFISGPRNCVGQHLALIKLKIMTIRFLDEFDIGLDPKFQPIYWQKSHYEFKDSKFLRLTKRKKQQ